MNGWVPNSPADTCIPIESFAAAVCGGLLSAQADVHDPNETVTRSRAFNFTVQPNARC